MNEKDEANRGARLMAQHADEALKRGLDAMNDYLISVGELNAKRKTGAGLTAATMLYVNVLTNVKLIGEEGLANLAMGLFQLHVNEAIAEVADIATVDGTEEQE
jgi:hypothetical protein